MQISTESALVAGPIPLYYQLERDLRDRISRSEFAPGALLPTEDRIGEQYGVSRITVRRALDALRQDGLIERRRGVGSFVTERSSGINSYLTGSLSEFLAAAGTMRNRCLSFEEVDAGSDVRQSLGLADGSRAFRLRAVGALDDAGPVAYLEIWFPLQIGRSLDPQALHGKKPVIRFVEEAIGTRIARAEQVVEPGHAGEEAGTHLGIAAETPVLRVRRVYFAASDQPMEVAYVWYHPERYHYAIEFRN